MGRPLPIGQTKHLNVKSSVEKHGTFRMAGAQGVLQAGARDELERCNEPDQEGPFMPK